MFYLTILFLAFLPASVWLMIYYRKDDLEPEPKRLVWMTFFYGMLTAVPLIVFKYFLGLYPQHDPYVWLIQYIGFAAAGILVVILFALLEEYVKSLALLVVVTEYNYEINQVVDGIIYGVAGALGFSFVENVIYLLDVGTSMSTEMIWVFLARAFGSTLAHSLFTGFFGYLFVKAYFMPRVINKRQKNPAFYYRSFIQGLKLHIIRTHLFFNRPSEGGHHANTLLAEALIAATLLHTSYNLLLTWAPFGNTLSALIVPLLFVLVGVMWGVFAKKVNHEYREKIKVASFNILAFPERMKRRREGSELYVNMK